MDILERVACRSVHNPHELHAFRLGLTTELLGDAQLSSMSFDDQTKMRKDWRKTASRLPDRVTYMTSARGCEAGRGLTRIKITKYTLHRRLTRRQHTYTHKPLRPLFAIVAAPRPRGISTRIRIKKVSLLHRIAHLSVASASA